MDVDVDVDVERQVVILAIVANCQLQAARSGNVGEAFAVQVQGKAA